MLLYTNLNKKRDILESFISQMQKVNSESDELEEIGAIYRANIRNNLASNSLVDNYLAGNNLGVDSKPAYYAHEKAQDRVRNNEVFSQKDRDEIIRKWMQEPYVSCPLFKDKLTVPTLAGVYVRSKTEAAIADELFRMGIPFRYECELKLKNGIVFYPDFTILCPWNLKIYYWEHFGIIDDENYRRKTYRKLSDYGDNEIFPMIDLITTYETKTAILGSAAIEKIINHYFVV